MLPNAQFPRRLSMSLIVLGVLMFALGVGMQMRGIRMPDTFALLTGAETAFGIMVRVGGPFCLLGLGLMALTTLMTEGDRSGEGRSALVVQDSDMQPEQRSGVGPAHLAQWQRRLAEKAAAPAASPAAATAGRGTGTLARNLNKAALVMVGVALAGTLAAALLGGDAGGGLAGSDLAAIESPSAG